MFAQKANLQTWADVHDRMDVDARHDTGALLTTVGRHPDLGAVTAVQSVDGLLIVSELPLAIVQ